MREMSPKPPRVTSSFCSDALGPGGSDALIWRPPSHGGHDRDELRQTEHEGSGRLVLGLRLQAEVAALVGAGLATVDVRTGSRQELCEVDVARDVDGVCLLVRPELAQTKILARANRVELGAVAAHLVRRGALLDRAVPFGVVLPVPEGRNALGNGRRLPLLAVLPSFSAVPAGFGLDAAAGFLGALEAADLRRAAGRHIDSQ